MWCYLWFLGGTFLNCSVYLRCGVSCCIETLRVVSVEIILYVSSSFCPVSGHPKTRITDQPVLCAQVVRFVDQFVPDFVTEDILYVRSMRSMKTALYNVQCRSVTKATLVKSIFASLVKSDDPPDFLGDVSIAYSHSLGTRIRLSLMRSISKRQRERDPKAICSVTSFTARPMMRYLILI